MSNKVFFVDDEPGVRKAIKLTLSGIPGEVFCFSGGQSCLEAIENFGCDLLVTDINMPGMSGLELIEKARALRPELPVIAITGFGDVPTAVSAMQAGAINFIEKPLDEDVLIEAIHSGLGASGSFQAIEGNLTETERTILSYVVAGYTNKEIAKSLNRSVRTIENHRLRITKKLDAANAAELVRIALEIGIKPATV